MLSNVYRYVKAPADKLVAVSFNRLDVEEGYDFLYAYDSGYDGTYQTKEVLGAFTGEFNANRRKNVGVDGVGYVLSSGSDILLRLESDSSVESTGFEAFWTLRDAPVGLCNTFNLVDP
jgi:hypothetical protein